MASSILDFVGGAARTSAGRSWFEGTAGVLQNYIEMVAGWSQMTEEDVSELLRWSVFLYLSRLSQEENWSNNPNAFVAEEDDETELFSLRIAGFDLVMVSWSLTLSPVRYN